MSCYSEGIKRKRILQNQTKTYVSFSGGKDSTAMLLKIIENGIKYDEIVFADTQMEYTELYYFIDYFKKQFPDIKITTLTPKSYTVKELIDRNKKIRDKLLLKGYTVVNLDDIYPPNWTEDTIITLWDFWFYGIVTRGANGGTIRGFPTTLKGSCWYKREAKVNPLQKYMEDAKVIYVGIANDEKRRHNDKDNRVKHILVDFNMSEEECAKYLQQKGLHNPIYDKYNRSGCYNCPRQNKYGLYMLWLNDKQRWNDTKHWDKENRRVRGLLNKAGKIGNGSGCFINRKTMEDINLDELEIKFSNGIIPDKNLKYECHSCQNIF